MKRLLLWPGNHPYVVLLLVAVMSAMAVVPGRTVQVNISVESFLPEQGEALRLYEKTTSTFGSDKYALIYAKDPDLFTPEKLRKLQGIHDSIREARIFDDVTSIFTVPALTSGDEGVNTRPILSEIPETTTGADDVKEQLLNHRMAKGRVIFGDGDRVMFLLALPSGEKGTAFFKTLHDKIERRLKTARSSFDQLYQFGAPYLYYEFAQKIRGAFVVVFPLCFILGIGVMYGLNRDWRAAALPVLTTAVATFWTIGFMGFMGISFNLLTWIVPMLIFTIGSTEDMHLLNGYQRTDGPERNQAFARSLSTPVFLTFLTTALGFLVIAFNDTAMIRDFAFSASFGMVANFTATVLIVPPILFNTTGNQGVDTWQEPFIKALQTIKNYPLATIGLSVAVGGVAVFYIPSIEIGSNFREYFGEETTIRERWRRFTDMIGSNGNFYYLLQSSDDTTLLEGERLDFVLDAPTVIDEQPKLAYNLSITEPLNQMHVGLDGRPMPEPANRQLVKQLLLILPDRIVSKYLNTDRTEALYLASYRADSTVDIVNAIDRGRRALQKKAPEGVTVHATGQNVLIGRISNTLPRQQAVTIGLLIIAVSIVIGLVFRSFQALLFALPANLLPVLVLFGAMGLFDVNLDLSTTLVSTILIGLAVDDTVHFLACYFDHGGNEQALDATIRAEFLPVTTTSLAIVLSLLGVLAGPFPPIRWFGILMALAVFSAYLADVLLLPALLSFVRSRTN